MKHDQIWSNFGAVFIFVVVSRLLGLLSLRYINHWKK